MASILPASSRPTRSTRSTGSPEESRKAVDVVSPEAKSLPPSTDLSDVIDIPAMLTLAATVTTCADGCTKQDVRLYYGPEILGHVCQQAPFRPRQPNIILHEKASRMATSLLLQFGLDPRTTTVSNMDDCKFLSHFVCQDCREQSSHPTVLDFRGAVFHAVHEHDHDQVRFDIASGKEMRLAGNLEHRNMRSVPRRQNWGCVHCSAHVTRNVWFTRRQAVAHIRFRHNIVNPREGEDYFFDPKAFRGPTILALSLGVPDMYEKLKQMLSSSSKGKA
ncbi:hypothetical protein OF83DRAFT_41147 [Amylostereum chailletii]|nr:hypothetical protein OF83DRAFT_41147 [Amylostereum chailletii]